jgi:probable rRNA maturation factor
VNHTVDVQFGLDESGLPTADEFMFWAVVALENIDTELELSIRIVDEAEATQLNEKWRDMEGATNVLSFPTEITEEIQPRPLGDVVICAPIIAREAIEQEKPIADHWAHMVIHGTLHLLGYDHIETLEMKKMESLEIKLLNQLNINNPYI